MYLTAFGMTILLYPTLHKMGHCLVASGVDCKAVYVALRPILSMSVSADSFKPVKVAVIGMSGMIFPTLLGIIKPSGLTSTTVSYAN